MKIGKIINCNYINEKIFYYIKRKFSFFFYFKNFKIPFYFSILTNDSDDNMTYLQKKNSKAKELDIENFFLNISKCSEKKIIFVFKKLSINSKVDGLLIQMPLRKDVSYIKISNSVCGKKDLDFILNKNIGNYNICYLKNSPSIVKSCLLLIGLFNINLQSKNILIINKSNLIGKPLLNFFLNQNLTVTITGEIYKKINILLKKHNLIFSATGIFNFLKLKCIKNNSIIFDIGFGRKKALVFGDLENSDKLKKIKLTTTVPFGIGALNINFLFESILKLYFLNKFQK